MERSDEARRLDGLYDRIHSLGKLNREKDERIKEIEAALEHIAEDGCPKCGNVAERALKGKQ